MPSPLRTEQDQADLLDAEIGAKEAALVAAWLIAWEQISGQLASAVNDALIDGPVTASTVLRSRRLAAALALIIDRLEELVSQSAVITNRMADFVVSQGAGGQLDLIGLMLDDADLTAAPNRALEAIIRRTSEQVTSLMWPLAEDTYATILRELISGVAVGENPRETARQMMDRVADHWNFGRARAVNIARTEMLDAYRKAAQEAQDANPDVLAGWVWLAHLGPRTCAACLSRHGSIHELSEDGPEGHQQCRCSRSPVVRLEGGGADVAWVPSVQDHWDSLTQAQKLEVLGPERLALLEAGLIGWDDLARKVSNPGWRDSWVETPLRDLRAIASQRVA